MSLTELVHSVTHIVGGTPVQPGRFPFQAGILQNDFQFCGGSLIAPNVVLTAAHCAEVSATHVVLGCEDINDLSQCEVIPVAGNAVFNDFDNDGFLNGDIQLLRLASDSVQQPIALASPGFDLNAGQDLTVIGWGATNPATQESSGGILLEALLESTTREACDDQYKAVFGTYGAGTSTVTPFPGTIVNDFKMCAVGDSKDTCQGDSGGPIFMRCDATGEDLQVGIVSFGLGCAYDGIPGVYAKVFNPAGFAFIESAVASQGHSLRTVGSTEEFCVVAGTQPPEELSDPPTPFPTFDLAAWTCSDQSFAANDGCHCNCGIPDPDCEFEGGQTFNCGQGEICVDAVCVSGGDGDGVPPEWTCSPSFFGTDDGCDCECGAPDPDCEPGVSTSIFGCGSGEICVNDTCTNPNDTRTPTSSPVSENVIPPEWFCSPSFFADGLCDCNCGAPDPDCEPGANVTSDNIIGCAEGEICVDDSCTNSSDTRSPTVSPTANFPTSSPTSNQTVPADWFCTPSFFADGLCDCNCGAPDPDCEPGADVASDTIFGCDEGEICVDDFCTNSSDTRSPTVSPTGNFSTSSPTTSNQTVPADWFCSPSFFADRLCDCNCGAPDPDCEPGADVDSDTIFGCDVGEICVDDTCTNSNATSSPTFQDFDTGSPTFEDFDTGSPTFDDFDTGSPTFEDFVTNSPTSDDSDFLNLLEELFSSGVAIIAIVVLAVLIILALLCCKCYKKPAPVEEPDYEKEVDGKELYGGPLTEEML